MVEYLAWVVMVALAAAFCLLLASKWGWLEWLQVHAPTDWLNELFSCKLCCSWWICVVISVTLFLGAGEWRMLAIPIFSTAICRQLW